MYSFNFYTCFAKSLLDVEQRSHHSDTLKDEKVVSERQTLYIHVVHVRCERCENGE